MSNQYRSVLAGAGGTGGDALVSEVLTGKTFTNDNGPQTGTMPNRGAVSQTIAPGGSYTIPEGYHNGSGTVTASQSTDPASALFTRNENNYGTYTITGTNIKFVYAIFANAALTDGSFGTTSGSIVGRDVIAYPGSNYIYPSSGNAYMVSASSTEVKVKTQGGGCNNAQFFIVGDDIEITFA